MFLAHSPLWKPPASGLVCWTEPQRSVPCARSPPSRGVSHIPEESPHPSLLSRILEPSLPNSPSGISHPRTSRSVFSHHPLHPPPSPSHCMFLRQRLCGGSTPSLVLCTPRFSSTAPKLGKGNASAHPRITPYCVQPSPTFSRTRFAQGLCSPHIEGQDVVSLTALHVGRLLCSLLLLSQFLLWTVSLSLSLQTAHNSLYGSLVTLDLPFICSFSFFPVTHGC